MLVSSERIRVSRIKQCLNNVRVSTQYSLIQWQFNSTVNTRSLLIKDHIQNAKIFVASSFKQINQKVFFLDQNIQVIIVILNQSSHSLNIRAFSSDVKWCSQHVIDTAIFTVTFDCTIFDIFLCRLESTVISELSHWDIDWLNGAPGEKLKHILLVLLNGKSERLLKSKVEPYWLLNKLKWTITWVFNHPLDQDHALNAGELLLIVFSFFFNCIANFTVVSFTFSGVDTLLDCDVKRSLATLVQHEQVVWIFTELRSQRI